MSKNIKFSISVAALALVGVAYGAAFSPAKAAVTDLFNTGVNNAGALLGSGAPDPHYTLISAPAGVPINSGSVEQWTVPGYFSQPTANSQWIQSIVDTAAPAGNYTFQTTFTVPANETAIFLSGTWAADDSGVQILLNGNPLASSPTPFPGGTRAFSFANGFIPGVNTLQFVVNNTALNTGLQVQGLSVRSTSIPFEFEPQQGFLLGVPLFIGLRQLKKRKAKAAAK
jgi:hypothetical protein